MNLLLDTHTFLWYYMGAPNLGRNTLSVIEDPTNDFFVSVATIWEIAIKNSLGKLELNAPLGVFLQDVVQKGFNIMPIDLSHILQSSMLPFHHRDPFDRIIIGQAIAEKMVLVSADTLFEPYCSTSGLKTMW